MVWPFPENRVQATASKTIFALVLALAAPLACADGPLGRDQADVHASDGGRLLYRETHLFEPGDAANRLVLYTCPDGRAFARKQVRSTAQATAPDFGLEDGRDGYTEGVRSAGSARAVYAGTGTPAVQTVSVPQDGVIDAGFDVAVRRHWDALMQGQAVRLRFLVPSRKQFYPVRVQRIGSVKRHGRRAEQLRMKLDTWFGFAIPDVILTYARDDQRLLEFNGTGNVRNAKGNNPQVRIVFPAQAERVPEAALQRARSVALDGTCRF